MNQSDLSYFSSPQRLDLHVISQHQFLWLRIQIHLLVHPLRHQVPVQMMLEPVRSYVSGTISGQQPLAISLNEAQKLPTDQRQALSLLDR